MDQPQTSRVPVAPILRVFNSTPSYLDNEPLSNVQMVPLYSERYFLLVPRIRLPDSAKGMTWAQAAEMPLCLLTPDMQNRRIADAAFRMADRTVTPVMETNSIVTLYTIVRSGLGAVSYQDSC